MKPIFKVNTFLATLIAFTFFFTATSCNTGEKNHEKNSIIIGAILPLTGPAASAGNDSKKGLEIALQEINESTNDYKFKLLIEDSKAQSKDAVNALNKLNLHSPPDIIYSQLSNVSLAIKPFTEKNKQILIAVSGSSELLKESSGTYRNYLNPAYFAHSASKIIKDSLGTKKIGIFYANTEFGNSIKEELILSLADQMIQISFVAAFDDKQEDYKNLIAKYSLTGISDIDVNIIGVGKSMGVLIKQLRESNFQGKIIGGIELPYPDVLKIVGNLNQNLYYIDFALDLNSSDLELTDFINKYRDKFRSEPTSSSILAYDALKLINTAIQTQNIQNLNLNTLEYPIKGITGDIFVKENEIIHQLSLKKIQ